MIEELTNKLNYTFQDLKFLKLALTHRSKGGDHNERLEFLGDAVVNFIIAELLFHHYPNATEGELSRWRASLVNRDALAELAKTFDLGRFILLGPGELRSGGNKRESILSCTMEAVIGGIYLDGGFNAAREKITEWYESLIESLAPAASHKDPKTLLQEYLQRRRLPLPLYKVDHIKGEAHQQEFIVSCTVEGMETKTLGEGTSRRRAEQKAAQNMLDRFKKL